MVLFAAVLLSTAMVLSQDVYRNTFPEIPNLQIRNVKFLESGFGVAVGFEFLSQTDYNGIIGITNDGGDTWEIERISNSLLFGLDLISEDFILVNGFHNTSKGIIAISRNSGETWETKICNGTDAPELVSLYTAKIIDENNIVCAGYNGSIIKSADGGESWKQAGQNYDGFSIWDIDFIGNKLMVSMNSEPNPPGYKYLVSEDNGDTWNEISPQLPDGVDVYNFYAFSGNEIYGFGDKDGKPAIVRSDDSGETYSLIYEGTSNWTIKSGFVSQSGTIVAAGGNNEDAELIISKDGDNWENHSFPGEYSFWNMFEYNGAVFVGNALGKLYKFPVVSSDINSIENNGSIYTYPSPVKDHLNFSGIELSENNSVVIYTARGNIIGQFGNFQGNHLNLSFLLPGVYHYKLFSGNKLIHNSSFIKL
jgi:photosystem II stability/assembly factor-like uncharacterized protein